MTIAGFPEDEGNESAEVEAFRKAIARRIVAESDRLVDELFSVVYDDEVDAKVRLSAITILLDRALPKMGVKHAKEDEAEERGSRKAIREELEKLFLEGEDEQE